MLELNKSTFKLFILKKLKTKKIINVEAKRPNIKDKIREFIERLFSLNSDEFKSVIITTNKKNTATAPI